MKQRLLYIDALKGFTIALVVLGHVLQRFYSDDTLVVRLVYAFHIPLFMFLSGYVSYKMQAWEKIGKRAVQCLVPFFSAMLLSYFISHWGMWSLTGLGDSIWFVLKNPDYGLWFLWALFFINVIFLGSRKLARLLRVNEIVVMAAVAGVLNGVELLTHFDTFGYHWIAWYFMFFAFGAYWRTFMSTAKPKVDRILLVMSLCLFPIAVYFFRMHNEAPTFYQWIDLGKYFPILYRIFVGVLGIVLFYELFKWKKEQFTAKCNIVLIGGGTLGIYYLHFYFLSFIFLVHIDGYASLQVVVITTMVLLASFYMTNLCKRCKITRLLVLGENIFAAR